MILAEAFPLLELSCVSSSVNEGIGLDEGEAQCFNRPNLAYHLSAGWLVGFIINFISRALLGSEQN